MREERKGMHWVWVSLTLRCLKLQRKMGTENQYSEKVHREERVKSGIQEKSNL